MTKLNKTSAEYASLLSCVQQFKEDLYSVHKMIGAYDYESMLEVMSYVEVIGEIIDDISDRFIKAYLNM